MKECLVCHNTDFVPLYNETLLNCSNCGFVTANMDINAKELEELYGINYFKGEEYLDYAGDKEIIQLNFKRNLRKLVNRFPEVHMENVLEIGCAYGFFGEVMLNEFPGSEYTGIDIARDAVEHGKNQLGLELVCGDYLNHQFPGLFSDIFMLDVIEHLERPDLYLEKAYQELKPGGRIFITTGDISRLIPRIKKQNWRLIHPPTHLHYFSRETLFKLLQAKGFIIAGILYPSITRSMKLAWYSAFMLDKKPGRFTTGIHRAIPHKMKFTMNTFDIMFVAAIRE